MRIARTATLNSDINVTPLVDVCLVLLIIFMVVTPLMVTGVQVDLPHAATAGALSKQPLQVSILADRTLSFEGNILRIEDLPGLLETRRASTSRPVVIQADKTLKYGDVVTVLDACRKAGFEDVGLAATK